MVGEENNIADGSNTVYGRRSKVRGLKVSSSSSCRAGLLRTKRNGSVSYNSPLDFIYCIRGDKNACFTVSDNSCALCVLFFPVQQLVSKVL